MNNCFIKPCTDGDLEKVKELLATFYDPEFNDSESFKLACQEGHLDIAKLLFEDGRINPLAQDNYAVKLTAYYGHLDIIKFLLTIDGVNVAEQNNYAFRNSCQNGHLEVAKYLLTLDEVDPTDLNNEAIRQSVPHLDVVKFLLTISEVDPSANNNEAIKAASSLYHQLVIDELLKDKRVIEKLNKDKDILDLVKKYPIPYILSDIEIPYPSEPLLFLYERRKNKFSELTTEEQTLFRLKFC